MSTLAVSIIVAVITGLVSNLPWLIRVTTRWYKDKQNVINRQKRIIVAIARYLFSTLATLAASLLLNFDKNFVIVIMLIVLITCYFIASDVLIFSLRIAAKSANKETIEKECNTTLEELANLSPEAKRIVARLKELNRKL
ncbi:MAG: hypothetical protein PHW19_07630 [Salinivirgaceae bacterium]|nr:hypothetical protein [Salinivirgaceae bacterium]